MIRHPDVHVQLAPTASAWSIIQAVRRAMEAARLHPHLIGQATDELLLAGREGAPAVAARLVSVNDTAALLEELL